MKPTPPMPERDGSTTLSVAEIATAASNALPPFLRMSMPAWVASECAVATIAFVPTAWYWMRWAVGTAGEHKAGNRDQQGLAQTEPQ